MNRFGRQQRDYKTVKNRADTVLRNEEALQRVRFVVMFFHIVVTQGYFLAKYMFTTVILGDNVQGLAAPGEIGRVPQVHEFVTRIFFERILVTLASYDAIENRQSAPTREAQIVINYFLVDYLRLSGHKIPQMSYLHNVLKYEASKILTSNLSVNVFILKF